MMKFEPASRATRPEQRPLPRNSHDDSALNRLCRDIDDALDAGGSDSRASFGLRIRAALLRAIADPALLRPEQYAGGPHGYCRHLLAADPRGRYAIASLVWQPGQASPVHGHRTWCGYAVIDGALTETLYRWDADGQRAVETLRQPRERGAASYGDAGRGAIHRLVNPADAGTRAVSIHVYGVAGEAIATHVNDLLAA